VGRDMAHSAAAAIIRMAADSAVDLPAAIELS
jgi:hypothetical protein